MLKPLKNIFRSRKGSTVPAEDQQRRIMTAASVLLLEASHADDECTADEVRHIQATLRNLFQVSDATMCEILDVAAAKRETEVDLWQFSNLINQEFSPAEKKEVMEAAWRIVFADGTLSSHEDQFAHKLANLLRLTHQEMIEAKLAVLAEAPA